MKKTNNKPNIFIRFLTTVYDVIVFIINLFLCFLQSQCPYSIKKALAITFSIVSIIIMLNDTNGDKFQYVFLSLTFVGALLGLREFAKQKYYQQPNEEDRAEIKGFK